MGNGKKTKTEFKVEGEKLLAKVKELIHEGNIRRIIIKSSEGKTLIEIPLTFGVVGSMLVPVLAAVGAIAALAVDYTIEVEKVEETEKEKASKEDEQGDVDMEC